MSVSSQGWFKHWAAESLLSDDLAELTDHEERVWWRLLSAASLEDERWRVRVTPRLATKCASTPAKLTKALATFKARSMVRIEGDVAFLISGARWNEDTNNKPPSASAEATRERKRLERERKRLEEMSRDVTRDSHEDVTTSVTSGVSRDSHDHKEEEKEKEEEQEPRPRRGRSAKPPADALVPSEIRYLTAADIERLAIEEPMIRIHDMAQDYVDWQAGLAPNHGSKHRDQLRAFRNQLKEPWRRDKWAKFATAPVSMPTIPKLHMVDWPEEPVAQ